MSDSYRYYHVKVDIVQNLLLSSTLIATFFLEAGDKPYLNTFEIGPTLLTLQTKLIVRDALQSAPPFNVREKICINAPCNCFFRFSTFC